MNERIKELMEPVACNPSPTCARHIEGMPVGAPIYAAPVDAKAIRAEALEEAAKVCDDEQAQLEAMGLDDEAWAAGYCARQIRGLI
jgi:hypothetical protein